MCFKSSVVQMIRTLFVTYMSRYFSPPQNQVTFRFIVLLVPRDVVQLLPIGKGCFYLRFVWYPLHLPNRDICIYIFICVNINLYSTCKCSFNIKQTHMSKSVIRFVVCYIATHITRCDMSTNNKHRLVKELSSSPVRNKEIHWLKLNSNKKPI